jgi:hypothetical protein
MSQGGVIDTTTALMVRHTSSNARKRVWTHLPPSHSAIFSFARNSSSSVQHLTASDLALESISGSSPGVVSLPFNNIRSPVDPVSGGVIGDTVSERENELPTEGTNRTYRESSRVGGSSSRGIREGSEVEAVDRWWIRSFDESLDPEYPWVLDAPDDTLPDHPDADRGPYLNPGPRV